MARVSCCASQGILSTLSQLDGMLYAEISSWKKKQDKYHGIRALVKVHSQMYYMYLKQMIYNSIICIHL